MVMPLGVASRVRWRKAPRTRQAGIEPWIEPRLAGANKWHGVRGGLGGDAGVGGDGTRGGHTGPPPAP